MTKLLIIPMAALMVVLPRLARADGPPGYDATAKGAAYAYTVKPARSTFRCPPDFSRTECNDVRRIKRAVERRRQERYAVTQRRRIYAAEPRDRDYIAPARIDRRAAGKRCAGYFKVNGGARPMERFARGSALEEWRKRVRISVGEVYIDEKYSPDFRIGKCRIVGDRGIMKRCVAEGTACQP